MTRLLMGLVAFVASFAGICCGWSAAASPNIVLMFIDDMGYADIGPFGATAYATPHLDRLAQEGRRFTDFQVSSAVCSASRAGLLTGCYHRRIGIDGALGPAATEGIHTQEWTLAEICQQKGYATACFGKWHLGHHEAFLPKQHGFDEYFGLPYSNDMWPYHPDFANLPADSIQRKRGFPNLPLIDGNRIVNANVQGTDQAQLTAWYTERAVDFIHRHHDRPFLLYVPHTMVHVPLFVSESAQGKSGAGTYGDVVREIDDSVGKIVSALAAHHLEEKTLFIFTTDNGPWLSYGSHAGSAGPLREGKGTTFEGGTRVPTIFSWPGTIPANTTCDELSSTIDIVPTVAALIGARLPEHPLDGHDIGPLLRATPGAQSPHRAFCYYYDNGQLQAIRDRRWKLHFPHRYRSLAGKPGGERGSPASYDQFDLELSLFDLKHDPGETTNVVAQRPDIVTRLQTLAGDYRLELGDSLTGQEGKKTRPAGRL